MGFSLPSTVRNAPGNPKRYRQMSLPSEIPGSPRPSFRPIGMTPPRKTFPLHILTDLQHVPTLDTATEPLRVVPKAVVVSHTDPSLVSSHAEAQSAELTDILDMYLNEVIADATSRGVMSAELSEYLRSPPMEEEEEEEVKRFPATLPLETCRGKARSVNIVREALRGNS